MFVSLDAALMLLQYVLLLRSFTQLAGEFPEDRRDLLDKLGPMLGDVLALTAFLVLPLTLAGSMLAKQRLFGPLESRQCVAGAKALQLRVRMGRALGTSAASRSVQRIQGWITNPSASLSVELLGAGNPGSRPHH